MIQQRVLDWLERDSDKIKHSNDHQQAQINKPLKHKRSVKKHTRQNVTAFQLNPEYTAENHESVDGRWQRCEEKDEETENHIIKKIR